MTPEGNEQQVQGVRFIQADSPETVGRLAAEFVAQQLQNKPDSTLVFPTGNTPKPMYERLRQLTGLDWRKSQLFHLDEYMARPAGGEWFSEYMDRELWRHVPGRKHYVKDYLANPMGYETLLTQQSSDGRPDLVILGIGDNGHLAFNEPGSAPDSPTRVEKLAPETQAANFGQPAQGPSEAVTLGLDVILKAKKIILLATGQKKQGVMRQAFDFKQPPSVDIPASWLKNHPDVVVMTDFPV